MKPRVLLDVDGVVCDFTTSFLDRINHHGGTSHKLTDMIAWDMYHSFAVPEHIRSLVDADLNTPGHILSLPLLPGAVRAVEQLQEISELYFVTAPWSSDTWASERRKWIKNHFGVGADRIVFTKAKKVVAGDVLIDDKTENLISWSRCNPNGLAIRWACHSNAMTPYDGHSTDTWSDVIDWIGGMEHPWMHHDRKWRNA